MEKKLENLQFSPKWVSHLGCVKGCLDFLDIGVSDAWLYGATGHAFIINMHDELCPSGPTAWKTEMLFKLGRNVGYITDVVEGYKPESDFAEKQRMAWEHVKRAIDAGLPCYGWELGIPEFYVVYGYDDQGRYLVHPQFGKFDRGGSTVPWEKVGDSEIGVLEICSVRPGEAAEDARTVKDALQFALEYSKSPAKWILPRYKAGLSGYDYWVRSLEIGNANPGGSAFNAAVWAECRGYAVGFLQEAKERIDGELGSIFDRAKEQYEAVAGALDEVSRLFPFPPKDEVKDPECCRTAVQHLRDARSAEEAGLAALESLVREL